MSRWVKIEDFKCPGVNCNNGSRGGWVCGKDETSIYLSQTGYIRCSRIANYSSSDDMYRYLHINKICNWRWNCGRHGQHNFNNYIEADESNFIMSMSMALQMIKFKGSSQWIAALVIELGKQYGLIFGWRVVSLALTPHLPISKRLR